MDVQTLYTELRKRDISLLITDDQKLSYKATMGSLTAELLTGMKQHKAELMKIVAARDTEKSRRDTLAGQAEQRNILQSSSKRDSDRDISVRDESRSHAGDVTPREKGRVTCHAIGGYNIWTRFDVQDGKLLINAPGGLLPEQRSLVAENRDALLTYLTTPPVITGQCRGGHEVAWRRDEYGTWRCMCSFPGGYQQRITDAGQEPPVPLTSSASSSHPEPGPASVTQNQGQEWGVLFVDIRQGQGVTEQGKRFTFPSGCSLSTLIEHALAAVGQVNRVYICGERPGEGTAPEAYINWLTDAGMMERYTTSKIGHSLDFKKPDMSVGRYQFRAARGSLDVRRITAWLGDDRDAGDNQLYTIDDAREALALLTKVLRQHFPLFKNLSGTPSTTFKHLWTQGNHIAKKQFPPLPDDIRQLIHQNAGQGRIEYFSDHCKGKIPGLYYYDGIFKYAAHTSELPTELASHDYENTYAGYTPARYRIRYTVPTTWRHVGLFMTKREGTDWRDRDGWWYPGAGQGGQTFETWVDGAELHVALNLPTQFDRWDITIVERLIFKMWKESSASKPLETITRKMIDIRTQLDNDKHQDAKHAHIYDLARGGARNILLHGIGSFNREQKTRTYILLPGEPVPFPFIRNVDRAELEDGRQVLTVPEESEADEMTHPEFAAAIWARCRASVTKQALSIPYDDIVTIRTDAIASKSRQEHLEGGVKTGQFRRKWAVEKALSGPATHEKFDELQHKVTGR